MDPASRTAPGLELSPGDVIAGKFRLSHVIGRGGMGSVWAARHLQLDMPVALKFIEDAGPTAEARGGPGASEPADARARFEREARAAGQIRSPHVVQMIDHGIDCSEGRDRPYIAMELLDGEDLSERLRREGRLPVAAVARILTQAGKALRRAHEAGIIHRDLKPGNVFLARFDDDEVVKILDFGVAKMRRTGAIDEQVYTQAGIVFGSPSYMSPEQARGARTIDHRSDLWSLAVIAFRAVTGVKPFQAASIADLVIKLCIDPLPVATRAAPDLPPGIDTFFMRAFARDPDQRFASAPELAAAFEAAIAPPAAALAPFSPVAPFSPAAPVTSFAPAAGAPGAAAAVAVASMDTTVPPASAPGSGPQPFMPGSGPHATFVTGTLTPPPGPMGVPVPALRPPVEPTPPSGVASLPSGGFRLAPPVADAPAIPPPQAAALPGGTAPPAPQRAAPTSPAAPQKASQKIMVFVTGTAGVGLVVALLATAALRGPSSAASVTAGAAGASAAVPSASLPAAPAAPPGASAASEARAGGEADAGETVEPAPPAASAAAEGPAPTSEPSAGGSAEPAPPGSTGPAVPRGSGRWGKKKRPNFGY